MSSIATVGRVMNMAGRPRGREKNITGAGKGVYKRGSGLGTGRVGKADGYTGRRPSSGGSGGSFGGGGGNYGGGSTRGRGGKKGGKGGLLALLAVLLLGGGGYGILGGEDSGVSRLVRERCDYTVSIPMYGHVNSLNVSTAASVLLCHAARMQRA